MQFYIGGGAILLILAIMCWFNKLYKTKYELSRTRLLHFDTLLIALAVLPRSQTTQIPMLQSPQTRADDIPTARRWDLGNA